jgi:hypothetical protein
MYRFVVAFLFSALAFGQSNNLDALKKEALAKVDAHRQLVQQMVDQFWRAGISGS